MAKKTPSKKTSTKKTSKMSAKVAKGAARPALRPSRRSGGKSAAAQSAGPRPKSPAKARTAEPVGPVLLSGGNPQIPKGDGDAPVQAYLAAMPGWKQDVGRRLDELVVRTVPSVRKAVRWNSPFYGLEGQGWFLSFHCITKYVKVAFFRGAALDPLPPVASKQKDVRYLHIHEGEWGTTLDEDLLASWIRQAAEIPGETCF